SWRIRAAESNDGTSIRWSGSRPAKSSLTISRSLGGLRLLHAGLQSSASQWAGCTTQFSKQVELFMRMVTSTKQYSKHSKLSKSGFGECQDSTSPVAT